MINNLVADFVTILLVFMRVFSAFVTSPIFGHKSIPMIAQIAFAFIISYMIFLSTNMQVISGPVSLGFLIINSLKEVLTGIIIGYSIHLVFWGINYAGTLIGFDIGLAMGEIFNPLEQMSTNVIGELIYTAAILLFFIINGHHYFIQAIASSFNLIPLGKFVLNESVYTLLVKYTAGVFIIAVKIASPIMVTFFLVHIAEGIISRVIPQMQIFFVMQPVQIALGMSLLITLVPVYVYVIKDLLKGYENSLFELIKAMGS